MTNTSKFARFAAVSLIAFVATSMAAPAHADDASADEYPLVDTRTTGSILAIGDCGNTENGCNLDEGKQSSKYPTAPTNFAFGF